MMHLNEKLSEKANRKWPMGIEWSRDRWHHVTLKGQGCESNSLRAQSNTAGDRRMTINRKWPVGESNGHLTDDVIDSERSRSRPQYA